MVRQRRDAVAWLVVAGLFASVVGGCNAILGLGNPTLAEEADGSPGMDSGSSTKDGGTDSAGDAASGNDSGAIADSGSGNDAADTGVSPSDSSTQTDTGMGGGDSGRDAGNDTGSVVDSSVTDAADSGSALDSTVVDSGSLDTSVPPATWQVSNAFNTGSPISSIWFSSLGAGVVAVQGGAGAGELVQLTGPLGPQGAVFSGAGVDAGGTIMNLTFQGLLQSSYGLVALTESSVLVSITDGGATFDIVQTGLDAGSDTNLAWLELDSEGRWTALTAGLSPSLYETTGSALGGWTQPATTTSPVPTDGLYTTNPNPSFWESPDGGIFLFPYNGENSPGTSFWLSTDRGVTYSQVAIGGAPVSCAPNVFAFSSNGADGLATCGSFDAVDYIAYSNNGGSSWTAATVAWNGRSVNFGNGFVSPDGTHMWLVGSDQNTGLGDLFVSSDSGHTFTDISAALDEADPNTDWILSGGIGAGTGFSLDNSHIWLGSGSGLLLYSETGGM
jgi:hypothetical protein